MPLISRSAKAIYTHCTLNLVGLPRATQTVGQSRPDQEEEAGGQCWGGALNPQELLQFVACWDHHLPLEWKMDRGGSSFWPALWLQRSGRQWLALFWRWVTGMCARTVCCVPQKTAFPCPGTAACFSLPEQWAAASSLVPFGKESIWLISAFLLLRLNC